MLCRALSANRILSAIEPSSEATALADEGGFDLERRLLVEYLKIWTSFAEILEPLDDAERGRLFTAMLVYAESGETPAFTGNERFIWPVARQAIDRARAESKKLTANGAKGGRPTKPTETNDNIEEAKQTNDNQSEPTKTNTNQEKPNESYNINIKKDNIKKDNIKKNKATSYADTPFGEIEIDPVIVALQRELNGLTQSHYEDLDGFRKILDDDLIMEAINEAVAHSARSWAYVRTILQTYVRDGIRTVGQARERSAQKKDKFAGKKVTAQLYEQRHYTEEELENRVDSL